MGHRSIVDKDEIKYYGAGVGSGKTKVIIEDIKKHEGKGHLYVVPTIVLANDIAKRLMSNEHSIPNASFLNSIMVIHDETKPNDKSVTQAILERLVSEDGKRGVTVITTASFHKLFVIMRKNPLLKSYHIILDEGLQSAYQNQIFLDKGSCMLANELFHVSSKGFSSIAADKVLLVDDIINGNKTKLPDGYIALHDSAYFRETLTLARSDYFRMCMEFHEGRIDVAAALKAEVFDDVGSVTIVLANFEQTGLSRTLRETNDGRYSFINLDKVAEDELYDTHSEKGQLVHIGHVLHPDDNHSLTCLKSEIDGVPVWQHVLLTANDFFKDKGIWIYTINEEFKVKAGPMVNGEWIPPLNAGLDIHKQKNCVAVLAAQNNPPATQGLLAKALGCNVNELYMDDAFNKAYQTVGRTSIRNREKQDKIYMLVLSKALADQLLETFKGSVNLGQIGELPSVSSQSNAEKGKGPKAAALQRNGGRDYSVNKVKIAIRRENKKRRDQGLPAMNAEEKAAFYDEKYG